MKFWEKNRQAPLNVVVVGEYNVISRFYYDAFQHHLGENIYVFKWESMHHQSDFWTYPQFVEWITKAIEALNLNWSRTVLIGHGVGGIVVNQLADHLQPLGVGLIAPVFYTNFINPFANRIPSYKPNLHSVYLNLHKMYLYPENFYGSISSPTMVKYYDYYLKNMMFFETIRAQVSHYETLKDLKERERTNYAKNFLVWGEQDGIISPVETFHLVHQKKDWFHHQPHFQNKWDAHIFPWTSHCLNFEVPDQFFALLRWKIREWLKDDSTPHPGSPWPEFGPETPQLKD